MIKVHDLISHILKYAWTKTVFIFLALLFSISRFISEDN